MNENDKKIISIQDYLKEKQLQKNNMDNIDSDIKYENLKDLSFDDDLSYNNTDDRPDTNATGLYIDNVDEEKLIDEGTILKSRRYLLDNILIYSSLILLPILASLSIISMHTLYLVRKPFNYIVIIGSGLCLIGMLVGFILKLVHRNRQKKSKFWLVNIIIMFIFTIIDVGLLYIFVKKKLWKLMDKVITHYKVILILFFIFLLLIIALIVITKLKKRKFKRNIKILFLNLILCLYFLCFVDGMLVLYRSSAFKEWLITTAMQTMNHQYLCKWFYSEGEINKVLGDNYVLESGDSTDPSLVDKEEVITYANEYERQILEHDKDASYKIINLEVNGCKGYLAAVYDPTTVHLAITQHLGSYGQYVTTMAKSNNAVLAINGAGFYDPGYSSSGGSPTGITISDGKVITRGEYGTNTQSGGIIGFDQDGILYLLKNVNVNNAVNMGIKNAVTWGPFLIVNGERSFIKGNGGWGYAARTAIGQRKDGIVLFLVVDSNASRTNGADMVDLTDIMENYGAINAANLDGGTSSVMVENGEIINDPIDGNLRHQTRPIADSFVVIEK